MNIGFKNIIISLMVSCCLYTPLKAMNISYDGIVTEYKEESISLYMDGKQIKTSSMPPILLKGITLVPVREVFEALGASVEWQAEQNQTTITYNDTSIVLQENNPQAQINGELFQLPISTKIINNKAMVPLRFISEHMGFLVDWNSDLRHINITTNLVAENKMSTLKSSNLNTNVETVEYSEYDSISLTKNESNVDAMPIPLRSEHCKPLRAEDRYVSNSKQEYDLDIYRNEVQIEVAKANIIPKATKTESFIKSESFTKNRSLPTNGVVSYDRFNSDILVSLINGLDIHKVTVKDNYREKQLIIDLGAPLAYKDETIIVKDGVVNSITVVTDNTTKLIVDQTTINACEIIQNDTNLVIDLGSPREKYDKIVVLDIGHGGEDPGAVGNGLIEKDLNTYQTMEVKRLLEENTDIKVYMTREKDETLTLEYRSELPNEIDADVFISFHNNFANTDAQGTEVFYKSTENSQVLAELILNNVIDYTGMFNRGTKPGDIYKVLRSSDMSAVLLEGGFLSNLDDVAVIDTPWFTEQYAKAVYDGIVEYFNIYDR
ncbi:hypothetical protein AN639_00740 [Candidatus Epulonipiscium fishelsonii]|uniref:Uncharacterized protein n=1 Tax=Candidatus Epulonipiscium fishelsonii TaxID=77094 RepID=A0ACC8X7C2_9FIRM|nr:hypothetical protein AN396_12415 [Epulopiscium sp. SCG-B11WGA-EpuloA1]ONI41325.1 hypothetical protein AN639_00740 [Epulopiscium sp. SCG-B05WGA-EpuloA1]